MADEVVIGSSGTDLLYTCLDGDGLVKNVTGSTVRLQGRAADLPGFTSATVSVGGCSASSSTTLTRASGSFIADGVQVDWLVAATGVPVGTKVVSVGTTTLVMSAAGGAGTGLTAVFTVDGMDKAGTLLDPTNGVVKWAGIGDYVTAADLAGKPSAMFTLKVKETDAATKVTYRPPFDIKWLNKPI